eukprot:Gb_33708 [translate_table: standard]
MWRHGNSLGRALSRINVSRLLQQKQQQQKTIAWTVCRSFSAPEPGSDQVTPQAPRSPGPQASMPASRINTRQVQSAGCCNLYLGTKASPCIVPPGVIVELSGWQQLIGDVLQ